ncbi:ferritin-like domain-containing protein [Sphingomonas sp. RB3P16]|uniref:ferritin-like domain-containing protein n=1 Tax=Parasphingomonas frigoris TaxID=3096163 RepID=UPI002FC84ED6
MFALQRFSSVHLRIVLPARERCAQLSGLQMTKGQSCPRYEKGSRAMAAPEDLMEIYTDELKDLWSANNQMKKVLKKITTKASDAALKEMLTNSQAGIEKHIEVLKELIAANDEKVSKEHCKGMEGLVAEATKHVLEEGPDKGPLLDVMIIAQYQRMTHYGIAGFGTAAAYADALGLKADTKKLKDATKDIYGGDEYMTKLAETTVNLQAEDA